MTDVNKSANEYFLTQAQYDTRAAAGQLEVGAVYHITDGTTDIKEKTIYLTRNAETVDSFKVLDLQDDEPQFIDLTSKIDVVPGLPSYSAPGYPAIYNEDLYFGVNGSDELPQKVLKYDINFNNSWPSDLSTMIGTNIANQTIYFTDQGWGTYWTAIGTVLLETSGGYRINVESGPPNVWIQKNGSNLVEVFEYNTWLTNSYTFPSDAGTITAIGGSYSDNIPKIFTGATFLVGTYEYSDPYIKKMYLSDIPEGTGSIYGTKFNTSYYGNIYLDNNNKLVASVPITTLNGMPLHAPSFYAPTTAGTAGYFLKSNGTNSTPTWSSLTIPTTTLNGSGTTSPSWYAPTSVGTSGYSLVSSGSGAPVWQQPTGYITCSTSASTIAKTATCSNFKLVTGAKITIKFTYSNTAASPTLNVSSTGAKAIYYKGSAASSANSWAAGEIVTFVYDGTYYQMISSNNNLKPAYTASNTELGKNTSTTSLTATTVATTKAGYALVDITFGAMLYNTGARYMNVYVQNSSGTTIFGSTATPTSTSFMMAVSGNSRSNVISFDVTVPADGTNVTIGAKADSSSEIRLYLWNKQHHN